MTRQGNPTICRDLVRDSGDPFVEFIMIERDLFEMTPLSVHRLWFTLQDVSRDSNMYEQARPTNHNHGTNHCDQRQIVSCIVFYISEECPGTFRQCPPRNSALAQTYCGEILFQSCSCSRRNSSHHLSCRLLGGNFPQNLHIEIPKESHVRQRIMLGTRELSNGMSLRS